MLNIIKIIFRAFSHVLGGILGRFIAFFMMAGLFVGGLTGVYVLNLMQDLPAINEVREISLDVPLRIFTRDEKLIGEYGNERRIPVLIQDTPSILHDAIIAAEDDRFYQHSGVDYRAILRAIINNFKSGGRGQGASTITMQVARNYFLNNEKTYQRKIKEVLLAFKLEKALTKEQILELYINKIFLGHRSYGFAAAAQTYYGRDLKDLNLPELSMLAGLPKAPSAYNPIRNEKRAKVRRNYVIDRMHTLHLIDDLSHQTAKKAPITAKLHLAKLDFQAPYVAELARQYMVDHFGAEAAYTNGYNVTLTVDSNYQKSAQLSLRKGLLDYDLRHGYRGAEKHINLKDIIVDADELSAATQILRDYPSSQALKSALITQVNSKTAQATLGNDDKVTLAWEGLQWAQPFLSSDSMGVKPKKASSVVKVGDVVYVFEDGQGQWWLSQMPNVSGSVVSLDAKTGAILAMVGGFDYYLSKFNRAVQARRQLGSNIKPFIYAAALEQGLSPASLVSGAPITVENSEGIWRPENYSKKFIGPTRLREALSLSLNLVSVRLLRAIGIDYVTKFLRGFGFERSTLPKNLSLALGSASVTPLQVVSAYATLANGERKVRPFFIRGITDRKGDYISKTESACDICSVLDEDKRPFAKLNDAELGAASISPQSQFLIKDMMKGVITSGTGRKALVLKRSDLAGKTGTTNDYRDAWFSGFTDKIATSVWVGFDQPSYLGRRESGAGAALPIWIDHMRVMLKDYPMQPQLIPAQISKMFVDKQTGERTHAQNPDGYWEYFHVGANRVGVVSQESNQNNILGAQPKRTTPTTLETDAEALF